MSGDGAEGQFRLRRDGLVPNNAVQRLSADPLDGSIEAGFNVCRRNRVSDAHSCGMSVSADSGETRIVAWSFESGDGCWADAKPLCDVLLPKAVVFAELDEAAKHGIVLFDELLRQVG